MSGGMAFIYDEQGLLPDRANPETIIWQRLDSDYWETRLRLIVEEHAAETQSRFAGCLLNDWQLERTKFWQIVPKEMLSRLDQPLSDRPAVRATAE